MDLTNFNFTCPHCRESVMKGDLIELITVRSSGEKGKIQMASSIGNYSFKHIPPISFRMGEVIQFLCPFCVADLDAKSYPNYAMLTMEVGNGIQFDVIFSRVAGVRETRIITEDGIETYTG